MEALKLLLLILPGSYLCSQIPILTTFEADISSTVSAAAFTPLGSTLQLGPSGSPALGAVSCSRACSQVGETCGAFVILGSECQLGAYNGSLVDEGPPYVEGGLFVLSDSEFRDF